MNSKKILSNTKQQTKSLKFTISTGSGDGAYLCYQKVTKEICDYFQENDLDLEEYALDCDYAEANNIPEEMQPFEAGARGAFGCFECCISVDEDLQLTVEDQESNAIYSGHLPKSNFKKDKNSSDSIKDKEKGIYVAGYEGLEDCYITGTFEIESEFYVKKFFIKYGLIDYEVGERDWISSITYNGQDVDWTIESYEGTGDNRFEFIEVK